MNRGQLCYHSRIYQLQDCSNYSAWLINHVWLPSVFLTIVARGATSILSSSCCHGDWLRSPSSNLQFVWGRLSHPELLSKSVSISKSVSSIICFLVSLSGNSEYSVLLRFLDRLSTASGLGCSNALFTLNEGNFGREARNPNSMLWDLSNGLGPIAGVPVPKFDGRPAVEAGLWHTERFLEEFAVVCETDCWQKIPNGQILAFNQFDWSQWNVEHVYGSQYLLCKR